MPMQLVFGHDAIINTKFVADWDYIKQRKQQRIHANNIERTRSVLGPHTYNGADKVVVKQHNPTKYGGPEYQGPYTIVTVNDNDTVHIQKGTYYEIVNI
jgi:hypothetical protein